jgi:hypothetical protein
MKKKIRDGIFFFYARMKTRAVCMASGKKLQAIVDIAGSINPSLV